MEKKNLKLYIINAAAIVLLLCFFIPFSFVILKTHGVNAVAAAAYARTSAGFTTAAAAFSGLEIFLLVVVGIIGIGALVCLILFMLIFPLINARFGTKIPCLNPFETEENRPAAKKSPAKSNGGKRATQPAARKKSAERMRQTRADVAGGEGYSDLREVKTVRIDKLYKGDKAKDANITPSKIDAAMRTQLGGETGPKGKDVKKPSGEKRNGQIKTRKR